MSGEALTDAFMLGTATVMLGPVADLMILSEAHSVGLVKNMTVKTSPGFTELTQGVKNTLVYSVMTANKSMCEGEMYEYTGKNMSYALGLDGSSVVALAVTSLTATELAAPTLPTLTAAAVAMTASDGSKFTVGDYWTVQIGSGDQIFARKVVSKSTDTITFDSGFPVAIPVGSVWRKMNVLAIGSLTTQPFLSCKMVGTLANGDKVVMLFPKVRVASGLSMAFKTGSFENIPLTLDLFDLVPTDPLYAMFQSVGPGGDPAKAMLLTDN